MRTSRLMIPVLPAFLMVVAWAGLCAGAANETLSPDLLSHLSEAESY